MGFENRVSEGVYTPESIFGGFSCIISLLNGNHSRISGDQTEVAYPSG
jgi:hypothetical protein